MAKSAFEAGSNARSLSAGRLGGTSPRFHDSSESAMRTKNKQNLAGHKMLAPWFGILHLLARCIWILVVQLCNVGSRLVVHAS